MCTMKKFNLILIAVIFYSSYANASPVTTTCGVNKPNDEKIRLEIVLEQEDEFSTPTVKTIDREVPLVITEKGAARFGPKRYERIELKLEGCAGTANYSHYNENNPMNPMEDLVLKCVCR